MDQIAEDEEEEDIPSPAKRRETARDLNDVVGLDQENNDEEANASAISIDASGRSPSHPAHGLSREQAFLYSAAVLNRKIREYSKDAALVVANMALTRGIGAQEFMEYTEVFTRGIPKCLLVRSTGREVITVYA